MKKIFPNCCFAENFYNYEEINIIVWLRGVDLCCEQTKLRLQRKNVDGKSIQHNLIKREQGLNEICGVLTCMQRKDTVCVEDAQENGLSFYPVDKSFKMR